MTIAINPILKAAGHIERIRTREISLDGPVIDLAARMADADGTTLLLSGGRLDSARYHILGFDRATNLGGGINAWSLRIDPTVPRY